MRRQITGMPHYSILKRAPAPNDDIYRSIVVTVMVKLAMLSLLRGPDEQHLLTRYDHGSVDKSNK